MKKLLSALLIVSIFLTNSMILTAEDSVEDSYQEPFKIRCTCYTWTGNRCANGSYPIEGLTVAGKRAWMGKTIVMYEVAEDGSCGDFIGFFEFCDTGYGIRKTDSRGRTYGTIQAGESIDMYRDTLDKCYEWVRRYGDYVYIQIIDAVG